MCVVNIDSDITGVSAARLHEHTARIAAEFGSCGGIGTVREIDVEESAGLGETDG